MFIEGIVVLMYEPSSWLKTEVSAVMLTPSLSFTTNSPGTDSGADTAAKALSPANNKLASVAAFEALPISQFMVPLLWVTFLVPKWYQCWTGGVSLFEGQKK
ncbi:hypothetical protein D3C72_1714230 [compost metagenome]